MARRRRKRVDATDDREQREFMCAWEEQREYERTRPLVPKETRHATCGGARPPRAGPVCDAPAADQAPATRRASLDEVCRMDPKTTSAASKPRGTASAGRPRTRPLRLP